MKKGSTLYVFDNQNAVLRIFGVSSTGTLTLQSATPLGYTAAGLLRGTTLYFTSLGSTSRLHSFDVSNPAAPSELGAVAIPATTLADLAGAGSTLVLSDGDNLALRVFDVRNPASPVLLSSTPAPYSPTYTPGEYPTGVAADGATAFVGIDFGGRFEAFSLQGAPRTVVVGGDGSLGSVPAPAAPTLSLSRQQLSISGGNTVTLPATPGDNLGNHTATQNLNLASYQLVGNGSSSGLGVSSAGNVGIGLGISPAAAHLHVYSPSSFNVAQLESNSVGPHLQFSKTNGGSALVDYIGTDYNGFRAGALELRGGTSVQLSGDGNPDTPDLVVAANGNVGIGTGTTAPFARLDVNGTARVQAVTTPPTGTHNHCPWPTARWAPGQ